jgi:hypothetical protein
MRATDIDGREFNLLDQAPYYPFRRLVVSDMFAWGRAGAGPAGLVLEVLAG